MSRRPGQSGLARLVGTRRGQGVANEQIFRSRYGGGGTPGATGADGRDAGYSYTYSTNTASSDPGSGKLKFDSTTFASITRLRISETDADGNGIFAFLTTVDDPTSTIRGHILMRKEGSAAFALFTITGALTDNGTWDELVIALVTSAGSFVDLDAVTLNFSRTGDKGDTGAGGATGSTGSTGNTGTSPMVARLATAAALPAYTRTTNVLLANANGALPTIDGVAPAVNDLVLLNTGAAAGADVGLYNVDALGSGAAKWQMTRHSSMDSSAEAVPGMLVSVAEGTKYADTVWQLTTNGPIILNTTALAFGLVGKGNPVNSTVEDLKVIRGVVLANGTISKGTGFTITKNGTGDYTINYTAAFSDLPTVQVTIETGAGTSYMAIITVNAAGSTRINTQASTTGAVLDRIFHFTAMGPR